MGSRAQGQAGLALSTMEHTRAPAVLPYSIRGIFLFAVKKATNLDLDVLRLSRLFVEKLVNISDDFFCRLLSGIAPVLLCGSFS